MINWLKSKKFNKQVKEHLSSLLKFAYSRCNDKSLAEDLVQETCLKAFRAYMENDKEILLFKNWIFRILINTHISYLRKHKFEIVTDLNLDEIQGNDELEEKFDNNIDVTEDINYALSFLNEEQREVIYLVEVEGYSFKDAAETLGIPFGTLASRLQRGKIKLRSLLSDMGYKNKEILGAGDK